MLIVVRIGVLNLTLGKKEFVMALWDQLAKQEDISYKLQVKLMELGSNSLKSS